MAQRADSQNSGFFFLPFFIRTMRNLTFFPPTRPSVGRWRTFHRLHVYDQNLFCTFQRFGRFRSTKRRKVETQNCLRAWRNSATFGRVKYFLFTFFTTGKYCSYRPRENTATAAFLRERTLRTAFDSDFATRTLRASRNRRNSRRTKY